MFIAGSDRAKIFMILDEAEEPIAVDMEQYREFMAENGHQIAHDLTESHEVSTILMSIADVFRNNFFETLVFQIEKDSDGYSRGEVVEERRYRTIAEAREGHKEMVEKWSM